MGWKKTEDTQDRPRVWTDSNSGPRQPIRPPAPKSQSEQGGTKDGE